MLNKKRHIMESTVSQFNCEICLSPVDAISTFFSTGMDGIALGNYLLLKEDG